MDLLRGALLAQSDDSLRDYSKAKIDWNRVFSLFSLWAVLPLFLRYFFYYPDGFVLNFKPVPFVILLIIGTLLIPIQTSTEEYIFRGYLMQGFGNLVKHKWFF
jgi:membrane protease YdiL (CAAX protease family)